MVAPISNDKILPSESANSPVSEKKRADQGAADQKASTSETIAQDEQGVETSSVDIERANQIYNQSTARLQSGNDLITNSEQAKAVATEIRVQIEQNGQEALKAQTGSASKSLSALLEAAPV
jgi:hypothetical protein